MALALLAGLAGFASGLSEKQAARQERLNKRIEEINDNEIELAKSRHAAAVKSHAERKKKFDPIRAASDQYTRNVLYNQQILGLDEEAAYAKAKSDQLDISDSWIDEQVGGTPIDSYREMKTDLTTVRAPSVLKDVGAVFGLTDRDESVEDQIKRLRMERITSAGAEPTEPTPTAPQAGEYEVPAWSAALEKADDGKPIIESVRDDQGRQTKAIFTGNPDDTFGGRRGWAQFGGAEPLPASTAPQLETIYDKKSGRAFKAYWNPEKRNWVRVGGFKAEEKGSENAILEKYNGLLEIGLLNKMQPEEAKTWAFNAVKSQYAVPDTSGPTMKKYDDLIAIYMKDGMSEPQARAKATLEVSRKPEDKSTYERNFEAKVNVAMEVLGIGREEAKTRVYQEERANDAIDQEIIIPVLTAIREGGTVSRDMMNAFKAANALRNGYYDQVLKLGPEGLDQFVDPEDTADVAQEPESGSLVKWVTDLVGGGGAQPKAQLPEGITEADVANIQQQLKAKGRNASRANAINVLQQHIQKAQQSEQ